MSTPLQRDSGVPLYAQVSEILMQRILNGEWPPGASLPAEPELCEEFGVARGTLRQALGKLETDGRGSLAHFDSGRAFGDDRNLQIVAPTKMFGEGCADARVENVIHRAPICE